MKELVGFKELMETSELAVKLARRMKLKIWATLTLALLCQASSAQQLLPTHITVAGRTYDCTYTSTGQDRKSPMALLQEKGGDAGFATFTVGKENTTGIINLGTNQYRLTLTTTSTNVEWMAPLRKPTTHQDVVPGTNAASQARMAMIKRALAKKAMDSATSTSTNPIIIDVILVYTPAAAIWAGGTNQAIAELNGAVIEANQSFINCGINVQLNPIKLLEVNYVEHAQTNGMAWDLTWLSNDTNMLALQNKYAVDSITMFTYDTDPGISGCSEGMYGSHNIVGIQEGIGYWVYAHEMGHILGCDHDRPNQCYNAMFPYSYGYTFNVNYFHPPIAFGSVMSYGGSRSGYFSSPTLLYNAGVPKYAGDFTGTVSNNNVLTIQQCAAAVASLRIPPTNNLTVAVNGTGTLMANGSAANAGIFPLNRDTTLTLTAAGEFLGWSGWTNTTATNITVFINDATNVIANFADGSQSMAPMITQEPVGQSLVDGNALNLTVGAVGIPTPTTTWYQNGTIVGTSPTFNVADVATNNQGSYKCIVANSAGSVTSSIVTVTVNLPFTITQQPLTQIVAAGNPAILGVNTSAGNVTYQWYCNSNAVAGATNRIYEVMSVMADANYYVMLSTPGYSIASETAQVLIPAAPVITTQPQSQTGTGNPITLTVGASGVPTPTFQWQLNGTNFATGNPLVLPVLTLNNQGNYQCIVANSLGTVTSAVANVTGSMPLPVQQPATVIAPVGTTASFTLTLNMAGATFQWYFNSNAVAHATNGTYTIASVKTNNVGSYYVIAKENGYSVTSSVAVLYTSTGPIITQPASSLTVTQGQPAVFTVAAIGTPTLGYSWHLGSATLTDGANFSGTQTPTLTVNAATLAQAGNYAVVITNALGTAVSRPVLTVLSPPAIVVQPVSHTANVGTTTGFSVSATGTALTYQWCWFSQPLANQTNTVYMINGAQQSANGNYSVVINNFLGSVTSSVATLTMQFAPYITQQPNNTAVVQGQSTNLTVAINCNPYPNYHWYRNGVLLTNGTNYSGATSYQLTINSAATALAGNYSVTITNTLGSVTSTNATLTVLVPLTLITQPSNVTTTVGSTIALKAATTGTTPNYQWYFNGTGIPNQTNATYTLSNIQTNQTGSYYVTVTNMIGTVTSPANTVTVLNPPVITQQPAAVVADSGTTTSLSVACIGKQPLSYTWYQNGNVISGATSASLSLNGLGANKAGGYYVSIANVDGATNSQIVTVALNDPPVIITQPKNTVGSNGLTATLYVSATGASPLSYFWFQGSTLVSAGNNSALVIPEASTNNEGNYSVLVSNRLGTVTSIAVSLYVNTAPFITAQPAGVSTISGQPLTLNVGVTGRVPMTYIWKLGTNIVGIGTDSNASYTVTSAGTNNNGAYTVTVTNVDGKTISAKATVLVTAPPQFATQPAGRRVNANTNITLSCVVASTTPVSYQWNFNGDPINGANSSTLALPNLQIASAGSYNVTVSNVAGSTNSANAVVSILDPPVWIQEPTNQSVHLGDTLNLTATAVTTYEDINYQWLQGTNVLAGATSSTYSVTVATNMAGSYKLIAWDTDATNVSTVALVKIVKNPPAIAGPLQTTIIVAIGEPLQITLPLGGIAASSMQWFQNGIALPGQNGNPLSIDSVATNNAGAYTANITNSDGVLVSPTINVYVQDLSPAIMTQPVSTAVARGGSAFFTVACYNQNNLTYQWMQNRVALSGQTGQTLEIDNLTDANIGNYSVVVSNPYGSTASATANLALLDVPVIVKQPANLVLTNGASGTMTVTATGYNLGYQWQINGTNIAGATGASFTIASANSNSVASYTVLIGNAAGTNVSNPATVTLAQPPIILAQPVNVVCQPGASPSFSVNASGRGTLTYQWYYQSVPIVGQNNTNLVLSPVVLGQNGNYLVKVRNEDGWVNSATVTLTVENPPQFIAVSANKNVLVGQTLTLGASVMSGGGTVTYQWYQNGNPLAGATGSTYSTLVTNSAPQGNYSVTIANGVGNATSSVITVTVVTAPSITTQPANQTVTVGSPAQIGLVAAGTQPLTYFWLKQGVPYLASSSPILTFDNISSSDLATYSVIVSNSFGTVISAGAKLTAATNGLAPGITRQPQSVTVKTGGTVTFSVAAAGQAPLNYQWLANGNLLAGQTNTSLTFTNVNSTLASAAYAVMVANQNGTVQSTTVAITLGTNAALSTLLPYIVDQPTNAEVGQYQTLDIAMDASTNTLGYLWYKSGAYYTATPTAELTVTNAQTSLAGKYQLVVTNTYGSATSAPVVVIIDAAPAIIVEPVAVATVNSKATLTVTATGSAPLTYTWYDPNGNQLNSTSNTLVLTGLTAASDGGYTVLVQNNFGSVVSAPANIWVRQAPTINSQPVGAALNLGDTYALSVTAAGNQPLMYVWYHNGVQMNDLSASSITLTGVQSIDAGTYSVAITNVDGGIVSSNAVVTVTIPPYLSSLVTNIKLNIGTNVTLAPVIGGTWPMTYQWYLNGSVITGATAKTLALTKVTEANEGTYTLAISNALAGIVGNVAIVTISDPPVITAQPVNVKANEGGTASFTVAANGRQPLVYHWYQGTTCLIDQDGATYTFTNVMPSNVGTYSVRIFNADGSTTSANATMSLNTWPTITAQPPTNTTVVLTKNGSATGYLATNVVIHAGASGTATIYYQWYFTDNATFTNGVNSVSTNSALTLVNITTNNAGYYFLIASNFVGTATSAQSLLTIGAPPLISLQPISGTVTPNNAVTLQVIATGTAPLSYQWRQGTNNVVGATSSTLTLATATAKTAGTYTVLVKNPYGSTASLGAVITINTNANANMVKSPRAEAKETSEPTLYTGLFYETNSATWEHCGIITLAIGNTNYQGILTIQGIDYVIMGSLTNDEGQAVIDRDTNSPLGIGFDVQSNTLTGLIGDGTWTANLYGAAQSESTNSNLNYQIKDQDIVVGSLALTNSEATFIFTLPNGNIVNTAGYIENNGNYPVYQGTATNGVLGWLTSTPTNLVGNLIQFETTTTENIEVTGQQNGLLKQSVP